jgi:hydroxymethylpyrimidine pyrophosphatase-like HAD family hydrolase
MNTTARCLAFVDLDDTLFSSARKQTSSTGLVPAALLRSGDVVSYSNPAQRGLSRLLDCADELIPVTARSVEAYRRVLLRFAGRAVVSYGATILLADGSIDPEWAERVAPLLARARGALEVLSERVLAAYAPARTGLQVQLMSDHADPAYLVVRQDGKDTGLLQEVGLTVVADWLAQHAGFTLHLNGRILAVIPPGLGKAAAVAHLIEQARRVHGTLFTVGAGDSLTDLDFMRLCDLAVVPARTQLAEALAAATEQTREQQHAHLARGHFGHR